MNNGMNSSKVRLEIRESEAKTVLYPINVPKLPFRWGANPYRGCEHDCWYCYARYTHEYLQLPMGMFQHIVFAKVNVADILRKELNRRSWKRELVNVGTVTDPYQPTERKYRLTRKMLHVFRECQTPIVLTTKSHHVLDDLELLSDFSKELFLNVVFTVTTMDEVLKRKLEPSTCSLVQRFRAIEKLASAGITVGVIMSPVFPLLTDSREEMAKIASAAADAGVSYFLADVLSLRASAREYFLPYMRETFPDLAARYDAMYSRDYLPMSRRKEVKEMQHDVATEFGVNHYDRMLYVPPETEESKQLILPNSGGAQK